MSKARDLADFVSDGNPLADGTISVSEVSGAAPSASPTFTGDATFDTDTLAVDSTNNRVGIGTTTPIDALTVGGSTDPRIAVRMTSGGTDNSARMIVQTNSTATSNGDAFITFDNNQTSTVGTKWMVGTDASAATFKIAAADLGYFNGTNEYFNIDSSGNVLVGTTSVNGLNGVTLDNDGYIYSYRNGGISGFFDRATSDGDIAQFRKDGTTVGNIGVTSGDIYIDGPANHSGIRLQAGSVMPRFNGSDSNGTVDLGYDDTVNAYRFKDLYLSGGVVETTTTVTYASSIALTYDNGSIQTVTLTGNVTFTDSLADGEAIVLMLNAGASYTVTWPTLTWVTSGGNAAPTLTANDTLVFWKIGSVLYGAYAGSYT